MGGGVVAEGREGVSSMKHADYTRYMGVAIDCVAPAVTLEGPGEG